MFEPTDEVSIRFYLKLSKGWGWSGKNFHPHLTHFMTTENPKWHGPAASHLTLYIEPVGGNPVRYLFDNEAMDEGRLEVRHSIPYSDLMDLDESHRQRMILAKGEPLEFGHTLEDQIGGQLDAGFVITGFYEDRYDQGESDLLSKYMPTFMATRAAKGS